VLRAGCCAAFCIEQDDAEQLAIVAELDARGHEVPEAAELAQVLSAIRIAVTATHHVAPVSVTLVAPGTVPKTTSGKLQRYLCREALQSGGLDVIASWNESETGYERAAS
jgi:myxalamid-type polyketide synthase MxaE and MxaD